MTIDLDELERTLSDYGGVAFDGPTLRELIALARKGQAYDELMVAYDKQGERQRAAVACSNEFQKRAEAYERALREVESTASDARNDMGMIPAVLILRIVYKALNSVEC